MNSLEAYSDKDLRQMYNEQLCIRNKTDEDRAFMKKLDDVMSERQGLIDEILNNFI
jgi:hypothetical protein